MGTAAYVQDAEFESLLTFEGPVVVDCTASWCGPCRKIAPLIDQLATAYEGRAKVVKLDVDQNRSTAKRLGVRGIPAVFFFQAGDVVDSIVGVASYEQFSEIVERLLSAPEATD